MAPRKNRKCSVCGLSFPKEVIKTYDGKAYCEKCYEKRIEEKDNLVTLRDYIKLKMNPDPDLWPLIAKQIKQYKEDYEMSYSGMYATLKYLFEYQEDGEYFNYNPEYGIAFVPYNYRQARLFFAQMKNIKLANSDERIKECLDMPSNVIMLKRSDIVEEDNKFIEKKKKEERKQLLNLDNVEDDGIIVDDFYYFDRNTLNKLGRDRH